MKETVLNSNVYSLMAKYWCYKHDEDRRRTASVASYSLRMRGRTAFMLTGSEENTDDKNYSSEEPA